ncbi:hypothetical protein [Tellurirhabdus bombi]|uniref:hypothetical protein n=1 Tax=Tellurirhabdus bombi TaxID=2907205 RepID=UPI001F471C15|nr:hypothetical protein [Tellurirhabdus bombi]
MKLFLRVLKLSFYISVLIVHKYYLFMANSLYIVGLLLNAIILGLMLSRKQFRQQPRLLLLVLPVNLLMLVGSFSYLSNSTSSAATQITPATHETKDTQPTVSDSETGLALEKKDASKRKYKAIASF